MNRCRPNGRSSTYFILSLLTFSFLISSIATSVLAAQTANKPKDKDDDVTTADLKQIGDELAKVVLSKDVSTLLNFDRKDLHWEDEIALKDQQSTLFCYIFR